MQTEFAASLWICPPLQISPSSNFQRCSTSWGRLSLSVTSREAISHNSNSRREFSGGELLPAGCSFLFLGRERSGSLCVRKFQDTNRCRKTQTGLQSDSNPLTVPCQWPPVYIFDVICYLLLAIIWTLWISWSVQLLRSSKSQVKSTKNRIIHPNPTELVIC